MIPQTHRHDRPDPRFPNLFILGAPKCGTTSLHSALAAVPDVFMTEVKEPGFFSDGRHLRRGAADYLDAFFTGAQGHPLRGESTPWYLYSDEARQGIARARGDAFTAFVVLVRRPADRAYSMYLDQVRAGMEKRTFEQAVEEELASGAGDPGAPHRRYLWSSTYSPHLRAWRESFGADSVGVFLTDDLRDPERFWTVLSTFLGHDLGPERLTALTPRQANAATQRRWPWVDRGLRLVEGRSGSLANAARHVLPYSAYRRTAQRIWSMNQRVDGSPPPPPLPALMNSLDGHFRSEVVALEGLLGRSLTPWLPESIRRA